MTKGWLVVHAYSGFEKSVQRTLTERIKRSGMQEQFGQILVPVEERRDEGRPEGDQRAERKEGLGMVLFADAGNVWINESIDRHDLRASYGIGIRYQTPVGPLRIDYGQKMNRKGAMYIPLAGPGGQMLIIPGESPGEIHINIGHSF